MRPRQLLLTACGWGGLLTGAMVVWVAIERGIANVIGLPWLVWGLIALPPAIAGAVCLARRRDTSTAPAAVFASCAAACGYAVQLPEGHGGIFLLASVLFLLCAGLAVVVSAVVTGVMMSISGAVLRRRAAVWTVAALVFTALSIPSPLYVAGSPIQTIFTGNTSGENAEAVCGLVLLALPLVVAGLAAARTAVIMAVAWLPVAAAQPLDWYVYRLSLFRLDAWYYLSWLALAAIAALALAEARGWRSGPGDAHASPPGR